MPTAVLAPDPSRPSLPRIVILGARALAARLGLRMSGFPGRPAWSLAPLRLQVDFRSRLTVHISGSPTWFAYGRRAARDGSA